MTEFRQLLIIADNIPLGETLDLLCDNCPHLQELVVENVRYLHPGSAFWKLPKLEKLRILKITPDCGFYEFTQLENVKYLTNLEVLWLNYLNNSVVSSIGVIGNVWKLVIEFLRI